MMNGVSTERFGTFFALLMDTQWTHFSGGVKFLGGFPVAPGKN